MQGVRKQHMSERREVSGEGARSGYTSYIQRTTVVDVTNIHNTQE